MRLTLPSKKRKHIESSPLAPDGTEIVPMLDSHLAQYLLLQEQMAKRSYLVAFGPYSKDVSEFLEYPQSDYEGTKDGTIVVTYVLRCDSTAKSTDMAIALSVDIEDFNTHSIKMSEVNILSLKETSDENEVMRFITLAMNKFNFIFMPE